MGKHTTAEYYTIGEARLAQIVAAVQAIMPDAASAEVRATCLDDWPAGQEHQDWLDSADVDDIAGWVVVILRDARDFVLGEALR